MTPATLTLLTRQPGKEGNGIVGVAVFSDPRDNPAAAEHIRTIIQKELSSDIRTKSVPVSMVWKYLGEK